MTAAGDLAKAIHDAQLDLAPSFGVDLDRTPWDDMPQPRRALLFGVAVRLLDRHFHQLAALYGLELGRAATDGVCGDTITNPFDPSSTPTWLGACVMRPNHAGMHEDSSRVRWSRRPDGQVVVDGSDATHSHVIGVGP